MLENADPEVLNLIHILDCFETAPRDVVCRQRKTQQS